MRLQEDYSCVMLHFLSHLFFRLLRLFMLIAIFFKLGYRLVVCLWFIETS